MFFLLHILTIQAIKARSNQIWYSSHVQYLSCWCHTITSSRGALKGLEGQTCVTDTPAVLYVLFQRVYSWALLPPKTESLTLNTLSICRVVWGWGGFYNRLFLPTNAMTFFNIVIMGDAISNVRNFTVAPAVALLCALCICLSWRILLIVRQLLVLQPVKIYNFWLFVCL